LALKHHLLNEFSTKDLNPHALGLTRGPLNNPNVVDRLIREVKNKAFVSTNTEKYTVNTNMGDQEFSGGLLSAVAPNELETTLTNKLGPEAGSAHT